MQPVTQFNTAFYYAKEIPVNKNAGFWRGGVYFFRKDNHFMSWNLTSILARSFEEAEDSIHFKVEKKGALLKQQPSDWQVAYIYQILAEHLYMHYGEKRLNIRNYPFHNNTNIIIEKIQQLSEHQKYLLIYPSVEFCYDIFAAENIFNTKLDLFNVIQNIEKPSEKLLIAFKQLNEIFALHNALLK
ncbi:hypothetical protein [Candidatus Albibeggiatoa sp. nov. NOAA]|uniref:hypothetical protein n=1 Tax=Candidatus Albibeggiatoa sp. nov. NOAA TaxID=3162724 RepID=UPI0033032B4D|nr:hypothetical protein [Thiotrichaceae bacterium]